MTESQARDAYDSAKRKKETAQQNANYNKRLRNQAEDDIRDYRREKNNLDDRLDGLNKIIKVFNNNLTKQFSEANKKAIDADDFFSTSIIITECSAANASICTVFGTDSVFANNDTNNAYDVCVKERDRVSNAISNLDSEISNLRTRINTLNSNIDYYNDLVSRYNGEMREYRRYF